MPSTISVSGGGSRTAAEARVFGGCAGKPRAAGGKAYDSPNSSDHSDRGGAASPTLPSVAKAQECYFAGVIAVDTVIDVEDAAPQDTMVEAVRLPQPRSASSASCRGGQAPRPRASSSLGHRGGCAAVTASRFQGAAGAAATRSMQKEHLSMRRALGLPRGSQSARGCHNGATARARALLQSPMPEQGEVELNPTDLQEFRPRPESRCSEAAERGEDLLEKGMNHISDLLSWMEPKQPREGGSTNTFAKLSVEVAKFTQESSAYLGGLCTRTASLEAAVSSEPVPKDPQRTGRASALMLQVIRALPFGLPLRSMLEPLTEELLGALYRDWPILASLDELPAESLKSSYLSSLVPYYTVVAGHRAVTLTATKRAEVAERQADSLRKRSKPLEDELGDARQDVLEMHERVEEATARAEEAEAAAHASQKNRENFEEQVKYVLQDFAEMQMRDGQSIADAREATRVRYEMDSKIKELQNEVARLTAQTHEKEQHVAQLEIKLQKKEKETREVPDMRARLERYESKEAIHGSEYASRLVKGVLGITQEEISKTTPGLRKGDNASGKEQTEAFLDAVEERLYTMAKSKQDSEATVRRLTDQCIETRALIPIWNADAAFDLIDFYDEEKPAHHQVLSMMDKRSFGGLGLGSHVPPYLRVQGFIQHKYFSKAELEKFMESFREHLFSEERIGTDFNSEQLHQELYKFMRKSHPCDESLFEFAYAFICGLEAHRDDPDFELFDLMLCGLIHPSVAQDQEEMLRELQALIRNCAQKPNEDPSRGDARRPRASAAMGAPQRDQVNRNVLRAALDVFFPKKPAPRKNALRRALFSTLQQSNISESERSPDTDCAFISALFSTTADGAQSMLIEEIRRQHYYEVIEFTAELTRRIHQRAGRAHVLDPKALRSELEELVSKTDLKAQTVDKWVELAFPEHERSVKATDIMMRLRHNTLLKRDKTWVKGASVKDVDNKILGLDDGHGDAEVDGASNGKRSLQPKRCKAVKVVDNPQVKGRSSLYSTPDGLEKAVLNHPRIEEEAEFESEEST